MQESVLTPMQNDNILIYNGNNLSIEIRDNVTKSVENLFNSCKCLYDAKIQKGPHSVWYVLNKNVSEYLFLILVKNLVSRAKNADLLKSTLLLHPEILQNHALTPILPNTIFSVNLLFNIAIVIGTTEYDNNVLKESIDLLA
jgi:hypothetical protein